jgi:inosine-uridine nucleoside N-ribohydrolase
MKTTNRRQMLAALGVTAAVTTIGILPAIGRAATTTALSKPYTPFMGPRRRVLFVNDLSGDVDGLFAAVHAVLSPSIDLRGIVATAARSSKETATSAVDMANEMLRLMRFADSVKVYEGATQKMAAANEPVRSAGTQAIIDEAMRSDTALPLSVAVGGGLTEVASALMIEPRIAERMSIVWIGGNAYPTGGPNEYNFMIDPLAAQHVFNATNVPIWQVPSDVYADCQISDTEIQAYVAPCGDIGAWLYDQLKQNAQRLSKFGLNLGETYTLGDSPLVLLTALTGWFPSAFPQPFKYDMTPTSAYDEVVAPHLTNDGTYEPSITGRKIRAYRTVDTRLMFNDFFAKLRMNYPPR